MAFTNFAQNAGINCVHFSARHKAVCRISWCALTKFLDICYKLKACIQSDVFALPFDGRWVYDQCLKCFIIASAKWLRPSAPMFEMLRMWILTSIIPRLTATLQKPRYILQRSPIRERVKLDPALWAYRRNKFKPGCLFPQPATLYHRC